MTCKFQWEKLLHHIINPEIIWYNKICVKQKENIWNLDTKEVQFFQSRHIFFPRFCPLKSDKRQKCITCKTFILISDVHIWLLQHKAAVLWSNWSHLWSKVYPILNCLSCPGIPSQKKKNTAQLRLFVFLLMLLPPPPTTTLK